MDEMLKTWKEPVPGSMTKIPVFPPEIIRPIENALIGARTTAFAANQDSFQRQQQLLSWSRPNPPYRETPTPPNARPAPYGHPTGALGPNGMQQVDPGAGPQTFPMHNNNVSRLLRSANAYLSCIQLTSLPGTQCIPRPIYTPARSSSCSTVPAAAPDPGCLWRLGRSKRRSD